MNQPFFEILLKRAKDLNVNSYLFWGRYEGKIEAAKAFLKHINCSNAMDGCVVCRNIEKGCIDIMWIKPEEGFIGIEKIREARIWAKRQPFFLKKKALVVDGAEFIKEEAQNALLQILEEAPSFTIIILFSETRERLEQTLCSRCFPVRFLPEKKEVSIKGSDAEIFLSTLFSSLLERAKRDGVKKYINAMQTCFMMRESLQFYKNPSNLLHLLSIKLTKDVH